MISELKPAPAPTARDPQDRDRHAYAASASSFITVLTAVNRLHDTQPSSSTVGPQEKRDATPVSESVEKKGAEAKAPTGSTDLDGETDATAPVDGTGNGETNLAADPESDNEAPIDAEVVDVPLPDVADTGAPVVDSAAGSGESVPTAAELPGAAPADVPPTPSAEKAPVSAATLMAVVQAAVQNSEETPPDPSQENLEMEGNLLAQEGDALDDGSVTKRLEASTGFPKTLNALLAENAVKSRESLSRAPATAIDANPSRLLKQDSDGESSRAGEAAPLPQSTATELGGIRATAPTALPRVPLVNLPGEIVQQIHMLQREGTSTMRLRLVPENLGELHLEIHRTGETVRVTMISPNPHIRDALDSQMAELRKSLEQQGLTLTEASVEDNPAPKDHGDREVPGRTGGLTTTGIRIQAPPAEMGDGATSGMTPLGLQGPGTLNILA